MDKPAATTGATEGQSRVRGERRWPMATAVIVAIGIITVLPQSVRLGPRWVPLLLGALLAALVIADPGRINRRTKVERLLSLALLGFLIASSVVSTVLLIHELVVGGELTKSASRLLWVGNGVWLETIIVFALVYWECDAGGSAARAQHVPAHPDFAFPQHMNPELAGPGWRPIFLDYLYLGLTNALAFSPTDAMPLVPWAKMAMSIQSLTSIAILGLVVARAVNVFT